MGICYIRIHLVVFTRCYCFTQILEKNAVSLAGFSITAYHRTAYPATSLILRRAGFRFPKGHTPLQCCNRITRSASPFRYVRLQGSWLFSCDYSCSRLDCVFRAACIHYTGELRSHAWASVPTIIVPLQKY